MLDLKTLKLALDQLEEERKIPREKIIDAIEQSLAAAYKKEYGKRGQIIRAHFDVESGKTEFEQVKVVVDDSIVWIPKDEGEEKPEDDERPRFNPEHHILLEDAKKIKKDIKLEEEMSFPLEEKEDFGRIAAQTAKQVIIQRIREAERDSILDEFKEREGEIISGTVQKVEQGVAFIDFDRVGGVLPPAEQIPGERYFQGTRLRAYLMQVEETPKGLSLRLSRTHPRFLEELFAIEAPEVASGTVEIKSIAREPGSRSKVAVVSHDENVDAIGSMVGQKGIRVSTVMSELGGEKIDIIPWSEEPGTYVANALSPAQVLDVEIDEKERKAIIEVADDQLSLAIGKGGQNVRLAAKLTGWKIDIRGAEGESVAVADEEGELAEGQLTEELKDQRTPKEAETSTGQAEEPAADAATPVPEQSSVRGTTEELKNQRTEKSSASGQAKKKAAKAKPEKKEKLSEAKSASGGKTKAKKKTAKPKEKAKKE